MAGLVGPNAASLLSGRSDWSERVRKGAYVSPLGKRVVFDTENLERDFDIRGTVFEFPQYGGDYIQRTGLGSRRYPIRAIFHGAQCDFEATTYEAALSEDGTGKLEHPFYGIFDVIPLGTVSRRDDLVTAANQSIVDAVFWSTIGAVYPGIQKTAVSEIDAWLGRFEGAAIDGFGAVADVADVAKGTGLLKSLEQMVDLVGDAFDGISSAVSDVRRGIADVAGLANRTLDVFVGKPLLLARQVIDLTKAPGRAVDGLLDRLDGYGRMLDSIVGSAAGSPASKLLNGATMAQTRARVGNAFHAADLTAMAGVASAVAGIRNAKSELRTKSEALTAAELLDAMLLTLTAWRDAGFEALEGVPVAGAYQSDPGQAFRELRGAVRTASRYLVELSFSLAQERSVVLGRDRNFIELASELYGSVDDAKLDLLIDSNHLSADEILVIPKGRTIVYYP